MFGKALALSVFSMCSELVPAATPVSVRRIRMPGPNSPTAPKSISLIKKSPDESGVPAVLELWLPVGVPAYCMSRLVGGPPDPFAGSAVTFTTAGL
jgi:hypothetical protein